MRAAPPGDRGRAARDAGRAAVSARAAGVSPRRRPQGWVAPGPQPAGPDGSPELEVGPGESLSCLTGDWRLFQPSRGHRWSLDDLVTAHVAAGVAERTGAAQVLDLGCGLGSVLLMLAWRLPAATLVGLEAQAARASMARRSIRWNGAQGRARVETGDLRELSGALRGAFALVTGTPPYFPPGTALDAADAGAAACRVEHRGGVEDYLAAAARAVVPEGRVVLCAQAPQVPRLDAASAAQGLALEQRLLVFPRPGKPALVVVDTYRRGAGPPAREASLLVRDARGQWTTEMRAVRSRMGLPDAPP
ncbi:MAG: methyltransferase domain-containing protein [Myxococcaceae bacterium]|nr:methyltransferase domain-containing protein [Myxococcaceae bacterium]